MPFTESDSFIDPNELLLRQVHPSFVQEGRITSQAFRPTPKDQKKLSTNRESLISPQEAYELHTEQKKLYSAGVWGITVAEVLENGELKIQEDPIKDPVIDDSHCLIDFSQISSESQIKSVGSKLSEKARNRGSLYRPAACNS